MPDNPSQHNRRTILKGISVAGAAAVGIGSVSATQVPDDVEMEEPQGSERRRIVAQARADRRTILLQQEFEADGFVPEWGDAKVSVTKKAGQVHHRTVLLPFRADTAARTQRVVYWTDLGPDASTDIRPVAGLDVDPYTADDGTRLTISAVENGAVSQVVEKSVSGGVSTHDECDSDMDCPACCLTYIDCESYNWVCITYIAATYAGVLLGCAACAIDPTKLSCGGCLAALIAAGTSPPCDAGNNCSEEQSCANPRQCSV